MSLPVLLVPEAPERILDRLDAMARAGRLAGYRTLAGHDAFEADAFAVPFDYALRATLRADGEHTAVVFELARRRKIPALFLAVMVLTVWPGVWLTDSMLRLYISAYAFPTWWWYVPLTVIPLPWAWRAASRRSRAMAGASAGEAIEAIRAELQATPR